MFFCSFALLVLPRINSRASSIRDFSLHFSAIVETRLKFVEWGFWPLKGSGTKKTILIVIRFVVVDRPAKIKEFFLE